MPVTCGFCAGSGRDAVGLCQVVVLPLPDVPPSDWRRAAAAHDLAAQGFTPALLRDASAEMVTRLIEVNHEGASAPQDRLDAVAHDQDRYFGVGRTEHQPARILASGLLLALVDTLTHTARVGTELRGQVWDDLFASADVLFGLPPSPDRVPVPTGMAASDVMAAESVPVDGSADEATLSWRVGHRVFFALIQSITLFLHEFAQSLDRGDEAGARSALAAATAITRGATASLQISTDFPADRYRETVRPSMTPPHALPGFSGVQGPDHHVLVALLKDLRPVFADLPPFLTAEAKQYRAATGQLYAAHEGICEKFVGRDRPSLLMMATHPDTDPKASAVEVIRRLAEQRTRLITPAADQEQP